jgi:hypothetical protein
MPGIDKGYAGFFGTITHEDCKVMDIVVADIPPKFGMLLSRT